MIGIVKPVGTPDAEFHSELRSALHRYAYNVEPIRLSGLLSDRIAARGEQVPKHEEDRINALMDEGDSLCRERNAPAAVAMLGVAEIRATRARTRGEHVHSIDAAIPVPRRYESLFGSARDRKDPSGARRGWTEAHRAEALPKVELLVDPRGISLREVVALRASSGDAEAPAENVSHPPETLTSAGSGTTSSARKTTRAPRKKASPPSPVRRNTRHGGAK